MTGPVTTLNANTPTCIDQRCIRTFNTSPLFGGAGFGGYACNFESSGVYGPPQTEPSDQTFYELIDASANAGTCDHIGFYAVQGQVVNNIFTTNPGDFRDLNCAGTVQINCFTTADSSNADPTHLLNTHSTFGSLPHQIRSTEGSAHPGASPPVRTRGRLRTRSGARLVGGSDFGGSHDEERRVQPDPRSEPLSQRRRMR